MSEISTTIKVDEHNVRIEVNDIDIDMLQDAELRGCVEEAIKRGIAGDIDGPNFTRDYAEQAYQALVGGRTSEALCLLERALYGLRKLDKAA